MDPGPRGVAGVVLRGSRSQKAWQAGYFVDPDPRGVAVVVLRRSCSTGVAGMNPVNFVRVVNSVSSANPVNPRYMLQ